MKGLYGTVNKQTFLQINYSRSVIAFDSPIKVYWGEHWPQRLSHCAVAAGYFVSHGVLAWGSAQTLVGESRSAPNQFGRQEVYFFCVCVFVLEFLLCVL